VLSGGFINDGDLLFAGFIVFGEEASANERGTHHLEITGTDEDDLGAQAL